MVDPAAHATRLVMGLVAGLAACAPAPEPRAPAGADPLSTLTRAVEDGRYRRIEAIWVERGGRVVYERYFRRTHADSRVDARSAGKSITAVAVGIALAEGHLSDVRAPVLSFFPDRKRIAHDGPVKRAITLEDLLTMSSALDCDDWTPTSPGNEERMYRHRDWTRFALDIPVDPEYRRGTDGRGRFSYCTAGAFLLGRVLERATDTRFDTYVQTRLFEPLGITGARWRRAPNGEVQSGGQLALRARDFGAVGRLVLDRGMRDGHAIVSRDWLGRMLRPRLRATPRDAYGYLWWIRDYWHDDVPHPGFHMSGNGGNKAIVFPDLDAVVVVLSTNYNRPDMHDLSTEIVERHILPALVAD